MTKASRLRDTQKKKEDGRRRTEEGERKKSEKQVFPATRKRPGTHQGKPRKRKERRRGGLGGGRGLRSRQVPMNLEQALVSATTYGLPEGCHL